MFKITIEDKLTTKIKALTGNLARRLRIFVESQAQKFVKTAQGLFRAGTYARTGPRGGMHPVPPPIASQLTSRHGAQGYKGAITFDMIAPYTALSYVRSTGGRANPAVYGPALYHHGGVAWSPMHGAFELTKREIRKALRDEVNLIVAEAGLG